MKPVIEFRDVSKRYVIGTQSLRGAVAGLSRRLIGQQQSAREAIWALENVSFQVRPGESVGIVGHNGAGKTTVLKLLAGITQPTDGRLQVRGRLGSLIELGAGFHPEMTGRENVYLNGVILGMTRREVAERFDSIIEFAGIDRFVDTPVKRYSSGMYVRLAFAVAAHIDPAVLLVDEVLAVGDIGYRAKCYRRMAELRASGTTVVLVSHNVDAVRDTCDRALLLWQGQLLEDGPPDEVLSSYLARMHAAEAEAIEGPMNGLEAETETAFRTIENVKARIESVVFHNGDGQPVDAVESGKALSVRMRYSAEERVNHPIFRIDLYRQGRLISGYSTEYDQEPIGPVYGQGEICLSIKALHLPVGVYSVSVVISETYEYNLLDVHHQAYPLQVLRPRDSRGEVTLSHSWGHERAAQPPARGIWDG